MPAWISRTAKDKYKNDLYKNTHGSMFSTDAIGAERKP